MECEFWVKKSHVLVKLVGVGLMPGKQKLLQENGLCCLGWEI